MDSAMYESSPEKDTKRPDNNSESVDREISTASLSLPLCPSVGMEDRQVFQFEESRKLGVAAPGTFMYGGVVLTRSVFSTPSGIYAATGNVGISIILWVVGGIITFSGLSVYLEFGLQIPLSGGEKNYLERVYRKPKYLATSVFLSQMILLGFSSGNSLAFGRYVLFAAGSQEPDGWTARYIAIACITFSCLTHAMLPKWGMRLFDVLGVFKVVVLIVIACAGFAALAGHVKVDPQPNNFVDAFTWDGIGGGVYNYATALLRVVYSYKGWENANYVLGEIRNPKQTLSIAGPISVGGVTILYVFANIAYFAAIPKKEIAESGVIVAGLFFRNIFGDSAGARALPVFVALSNMGNVLAVSFAHARVNQEFAKEGILPYSRFWASNKPFNAPAASFFLHWAVTVIILVAPPAGEAYEFIVDLYTYPGAWINTFVAGGLIYLQVFKDSENWTSPWHSPLLVTVLFMLSNMFLAIVPFIPPNDKNNASYPYYIFPVVGVSALLVGVVYWVLWKVVLPRIGGYKVVAEREALDGGGEVVRYRKIKRG